MLAPLSALAARIVGESLGCTVVRCALVCGSR